MENVNQGEIHEEFKKNSFSNQKIQDPEEFMLRTIIMKSSKYANLKVETKNVVNFNISRKQHK